MPSAGVANPQDDTTIAAAPSEHDIVTFDSLAPVDESDLAPSTPSIRDLVVPGANAGPFDSFLMRPTRIYTTTWTAGAFAEVNIDPWTLFLNSPMVASLIFRYKALRGDLHLKIQINGTPFHYGLLVAAYQPGYNKSRKISGNVFQLTTCPHALINAATSNTAEFCCPMILPEAYIDLTREEYASCGTLSLASLVDLNSASGTVDAITVNIYAHLINPILSVPIQNLVPRVFVPQMSEGTQASKEGFISGPLRLASRWAGYLTTVPTIGPYATAASSFASSASDFAKFFGYSRPRDLTVARTITKTLAGNMANTDGVDNSASLAVMQDQTLSIDPRIFGNSDGADELSIQAIAGKWSCVKSVAWPVGSSTNTVLYSDTVNPGIGALATAPGNKPNVLSPLYFASIPFRFWSGSIEIKIQIIASKYHRGRLRFQWDPAFNTVGTGEINTTFNHILEVSDTKTHTFQIPWVQPTAYADMKEAYAASVGSDGNGAFSLIVQNELTSPEAVNDAYILIWVRAGPDYKLAVPTDKYAYTSNYVRQGDHSIADTEIENEVHAFFDVKNFDQFHDVFVGDPVVSFRPLMKRYVHTITLAPFGEPALAVNKSFSMKYSLPIYPMEPGSLPYGNGLFATTGAWDDANLCSTTLFNYLGNAFLGKRGSYRYKAVTTIDPSFHGVITASRTDSDQVHFDSRNCGNADHGGVQVATMDSSVYGNPVSAGHLFQAGAQLGYLNSNEEKALEYEVPFYSSRKFCTNAQDYNSPLGIGPGCGHSLTVSIHKTATPNSATNIVNAFATTLYCAAGEDFTMGVWRGIAIPYVYAPTTTSTFVGDYITPDVSHETSWN